MNPLLPHTVITTKAACLNAFSFLPIPLPHENIKFTIAIILGLILSSFIEILIFKKYANVSKMKLWKYCFIADIIASFVRLIIIEIVFISLRAIALQTNIQAFFETNKTSFESSCYIFIASAIISIFLLLALKAFFQKLFFQKKLPTQQKIPNKVFWLANRLSYVILVLASWFLYNYSWLYKSTQYLQK